MLNPPILIRSKFENMKNTPTSPYWLTVHLAQQFLDKGNIILSQILFTSRTGSVRTVKTTGIVGLLNNITLPPNLNYLVENMHPPTWAFKWFNFEEMIAYHHKGTVEHVY